MTVPRVLVEVPFDVTKVLQEVELVPDAEVYAIATNVLLVGNPEGSSGSLKRKLWLVRTGDKVSREAQDGVRLGGQHDLIATVFFLEKEQDALTRSRHRGFSR